MSDDMEARDSLVREMLIAAETETGTGHNFFPYHVVADVALRHIAASRSLLAAPVVWTDERIDVVLTKFLGEGWKSRSGDADEFVLKSMRAALEAASRETSNE